MVFYQAGLRRALGRPFLENGVLDDRVISWRAKPRVDHRPTTIATTRIQVPTRQANGASPDAKMVNIGVKSLVWWHCGCLA